MQSLEVSEAVPNQLRATAAATMSWANGIFWMSDWVPEKVSPTASLTLAVLIR